MNERLSDAAMKAVLGDITANVPASMVEADVLTVLASMAMSFTGGNPTVACELLTDAAFGIQRNVMRKRLTQ